MGDDFLMVRYCDEKGLMMRRAMNNVQKMKSQRERKRWWRDPS